MFFLWHAFCPASRFWVWDAKGWRCSSCRYLVRADSRDASWLRLAGYHTTNFRLSSGAEPDWTEPLEMEHDGNFAADLDEPEYDHPS